MTETSTGSAPYDTQHTEHRATPQLPLLSVHGQARRGAGSRRSLTGVSEHTRRAYTHDVDEFVAVVRARRVQERVRPRSQDAASLLRVSADARVREGVGLAQGRVGARVRALPPPPRCASRATSRHASTPRAVRRSFRAFRASDDAIALLDDAADDDRTIPTTREPHATSRCSSSSTARACA